MMRGRSVAGAAAGNISAATRSISHAIGDRWSILLLREAYYGTRRFDEFQYYVGLASNILSARPKKLIDAGIMTRVPLPEHTGRYEYVVDGEGP